ncbi:hypothetical protein ACS0PU_008030 [Formica fusca]
MAELKAAPLFGSVRLQRLARGYATTARTPVSPAASAVAPPPPPPQPPPSSRSPSSRRRRSQSHQLSRRDSPHGAHAASTGVPRNARLKDRWSMVRRSRGPRRIEKPSRSSTGEGRRRPIPGTGAGGTGAGEGARVTRGTHTVFK